MEINKQFKQPIGKQHIGKKISRGNKQILYKKMTDLNSNISVII